MTFCSYKLRNSTYLHLSVVQSLSHVRLFATPLHHARLPCSSLSPGVCSNSCPMSRWYCITISSSADLFSSCLQSFPASGSFPVSWLFPSGFSISPSNEYSALISFGSDWFDLLAVQGTLKSFLQHQSSQASILQHSAFFMVQLSHLSMATRETIALTLESFVLLWPLIYLLICLLFLSTYNAFCFLFFTFFNVYPFPL